MKPHNHTDYQKRFFKEVKKQFPFYGKREKEYLKQFQTEIDAYLEEFPTVLMKRCSRRSGHQKML